MIRQLLFILIILLFSCSPVSKYEKLQQVKAWEPDIEKFEALDKSENYSDNAVLFAGSSSIRRWTNIAEDMAPYKVIQRGYGGAKLSDFVVYADRIFSPHKCDALVIYIGNDITGSAQDKTPEEVKRLFLYVLKIFRRTHPDTPFFWIAITPAPSRWKAWPDIKKANDLIKEACENHRNTYFIRTDYAYLDEKGEPINELFVSDMLHQNEKGYRIWKEIIKKELGKVLNHN